MIMQQQTHEELCNLLIQSLESKDETALLKVLEHDDDSTITEVLNRVPVNHVRRLIIEIRNLLSNQLTTNHLRWLQHILASKFTVISAMADGRSILLPLISLLDDRSSPAYYMKVQALKGKLTLLRQLKESRKSDVPETVVRIPADKEPTNLMEEDLESETESEEDFDDESGEEDGDQIMDDDSADDGLEEARDDEPDGGEEMEDGDNDDDDDDDNEGADDDDEDEALSD